MGESELSVPSSHNVRPGVSAIGDTLRDEVAAWVAARNKHQAKADGQFTADDARVKLKSLYPIFPFKIVELAQFSWRCGDFAAQKPLDLPSPIPYPTASEHTVHTEFPFMFGKTYSAKAVRDRKEVGADRRRRRSSSAGSPPSSHTRCAASTSRPTPRTWIAATTSSSSMPKRSSFTGNKLTDKIYYWHTGYIGGIKERTRRKFLPAGRFPERVVEKAVERMLPRGPLGRRQIREPARLCRRRASARGTAARRRSTSRALNRKNTSTEAA